MAQNMLGIYVNWSVNHGIIDFFWRKIFCYIKSFYIFANIKPYK